MYYTKQQIIDIIEEYKGTDIKQSTKNNYVSKIYNFQKKHPDVEYDENYIILFFEADKDYKITTKMCIISSLIVFLQALEKESQNLLHYLFSIQKQYKLTLKKKNETDTKKWFDYHDLVDIVKKNYKNLKKFQDTPKIYFEKLKYLIIQYLYVIIPPRRNEYKEMYIITLNKFNKLEDKTKNYLVYNKPLNEFFFSFSDYKTCDLYGTQNIIITDNKFKIVLRKYMKLNKNKNKLLFFNNKNKPYTSNGFSKLLNKVFEVTGKKLSSTILRKIFISNEKDILNYKKTLEKSKKIAADMGHSLDVQQNVYCKDD